MGTERAIEVFSLLVFGTCGLSMLLHPSMWRLLFAKLAAEGFLGPWILGTITLTAGAIMVAFHRVWHGFMAVVTVVGWVHVIEGAIALLAPGLAAAWLRWISQDGRSVFIRFAGLLGVIFAVAIAVILGSLRMDSPLL